MALNGPIRLETAEIAHGDLTTNKVIKIGDLPANSLVLSTGFECMSNATIGGSSPVQFGDGSDTDRFGDTADLNTAANKIKGGMAGNTPDTELGYCGPATTVNAKLDGTHVPTGGSYRFFVIYMPMSGGNAGALADRDYLS